VPERVTVVDYGMGNLLSVARALEHCGAEVVLAAEPEGLEPAEKVILPGVGAFADGMRGLRERGFVEPLREYARTGRPLLGICLGMHMLMSRSAEHGDHEGLDVIPGTVEEVPRDDADGRRWKVPNIGWSPLWAAGESRWEDTVLRGIPEGESFYFVHSFAALPASDEDRIADVSFGSRRLPAVVGKNAVVGTQFHPEKSGPAGLRLIANFVEGRGPRAGG
jgi:glutamine amidotransferase